MYWHVYMTHLIFHKARHLLTDFYPRAFLFVYIYLINQEYKFCICGAYYCMIYWNWVLNGETTRMALGEHRQQTTLL